MINNIGVIGAGTMGHGIALSFALYGYDVPLYDAYVTQLQKALVEITAELALLAEENFIKTEEIQPALARIKLCSDLKQAVHDRDYVIEATPEILDLKQKLFKELDELCPQHTILASNTSSLKLDSMLAAVSAERKQRMLVSHWYNPAHLMPIVELSCFGNMPMAVYAEIEQLHIAIKKQTVKVLKDVPGLVANRIQQGVAREVFSLIEMGVAEPADIDKALKFGPAFRYATTGQLEVADFGGLDIWCVVGDNLLKEMDSRQEANGLLKQKVKEGKLGIKTGEGFYKYEEADLPAIKRAFMKKLIHQLRASEYYT
jgi:3-hydroxybutyryl-CoA dehydrogenase